MKYFNAEETAQALPWNALIDALACAFKVGCEAPLRHHHDVAVPNEQSASLLLMPAWVSGEYLGIKHVLVVPENHRRAKPAVAASYHLYSALNGELLATFDGAELTNRRTAAASALASRHLSRQDSSHLLMVGAGGLAPYLIRAHASVRPIKKVSIWARNHSKAESLAAALDLPGVIVASATSLPSVSSDADIISCATLSEAPLVCGKHINAGTHVDLVGSFTPGMRESDDELIKIATLFADTFDGVLSEAGDFIQPLNIGVISKQDIVAELKGLVSGIHAGRSVDDEITVFKSVGTALEDLAAGVLAYEGLADLSAT